MSLYPRNIFVTGFSGSGKTTVSRIAARLLGWTFVDLDEEIARREGRPVYEIIRSSGLRHFRRIESESGKAAIRMVRAVIAVGGGWPAQPGHMDLLDRGTVSVWLRVSPQTALARVAGSDVPRPLLEAPDPAAVAKDLMSRRRSHYRRGHIRIDTDDRTPDEIVRAILERLPPWSGDNSKEERA